MLRFDGILHGVLGVKKPEAVFYPLINDVDNKVVRI